jgi:hypothetical protein
MDFNLALSLIHLSLRAKKKKEIAQQQGTKNETIIKILFLKNDFILPYESTTREKFIISKKNLKSMYT